MLLQFSWNQCLIAIDKERQEDVDAFLSEKIWNQLYEDEPVRLDF